MDCACEANLRMNAERCERRVLLIPVLCSLVVNLLTPGWICARGGGETPGNLDPGTVQALVGFGVTFSRGSWESINPTRRYEIPTEKIAELGQDGAMLAERYRQGLRENKFGTDLLKGIFDVAIVAGGVGAAAASGGIVLPVIGAAVANLANVKATELLSNNLAASTARIFNDGLTKLDSHDRDQFDRLLKKEKYKEAADFFEERTKQLSAVVSEVEAVRARSGEGGEAAKFARQLFESRLVGATAKSLRESAKNHADVQGLKKDLARQAIFAERLTRNTEKTLKALRSDLGALNKDIAGMRDGIQSLTEAHGTTAYQVELIQQLMFDQQPPSAKLQMLKNNMLPGLTDKQREDMIKLNAAEVRKADILNDVSKVVGTARDVAAILSNLGIEGSKEITQVVKYASVAQSALTSAFSTPPNPIGAIAAITGLFGGAGEDPNQQQFANMSRQLEGIKKQLDEVIKLQVETLRSIKELSSQIAQMEERISRKLDAIAIEQRHIGENVKSLLWKPYADCSKAWDQRTNYFSDHQLAFGSGSQILNFTQLEWGAIFQCANALGGLYAELRNPEFFGNPLLLENGMKIASEEQSPHNLDRTDLEKFKAYSASAFTLAVKRWPLEELGEVTNLFALYSQPGLLQRYTLKPSD